VNKTQKQIIGIEMVIITLLLWRFFIEQLTFQNAIFYVALYVICMIGWFYFKDK